MGLRHRARIAAFQALYSWDIVGGHSYEIEHFKWIDKIERDEDFLLFARTLYSTATENIKHIDSLIANHLDHWSIERLFKVDIALLRLSVSCMLYHNDIPVNVTINEAIEIAKKFGDSNSRAFVNGILDKIASHIKVKDDGS